ncbi:MAG: hypothetical protein ACYCWW_03715 [Deltaproteobacteria bacterium]
MLALGTAMAFGALVAGQGQAVSVTTPAEVEALCRSLSGGGSFNSDPVVRAEDESERPERRQRAIDRLYEVRVPAAELHFSSYDRDALQLRLDGRYALGVAKGTLSVYPTGDEPWAVSATPEEARAAVKLAAKGDGALVVRFHPGEGGCVGHPVARAWSMAIAPGSISFVGGALVLPGTGDWRSPPEGAAPSVRVLPAVVDLGSVDQAALAAMLEADPALGHCYAEALGRDPDASGSVVLHDSSSGGGRPGDVRVAVDTMQDPRLDDCLVSELSRTPLPTSGNAKLYLPLELSR